MWKGVEEESGLDTETLARWKKYLADSNKEHPYLKPWYDVLAANPSEAQVREAAERYQQFVLQLIEEAKEVDDKNYVAFGGKKGLKDEKNSPVHEYRLPARAEVLSVAGDRARPLQHRRVQGARRRALLRAKRNRPFSWRYREIICRETSRGNQRSRRRPSPNVSVPSFGQGWSKPGRRRSGHSGRCKTLGEVAPRRFLQVLCDGEPTPFREGSGRVQLAEAIASEANPLTARVMVNRIWQYHFGKGIVRTPSNFGRMGERPTHPELLDYLAADFMAGGWSVKRLHRKILLSSTYGMAAASNPDSDPDNKLLSHFDLKHRLDMETLRDSVLAVKARPDHRRRSQAARDNLRRSLYLTVSRTRLDPAMALFDFPDANNSVDERTVTAGPLQGLFWLNSEFVVDQARALYDRLADEVGEDLEQRIHRAYELLFARAPDSTETELGVKYVTASGGTWVQYLQALLGSAEFASVN